MKTAEPTLWNASSLFGNAAGMSNETGFLDSNPQELPLAPKVRESRILIVEDDPPVREALTEVLQTEGYEVIPAVDAPQAVTRFVGLRPDLILLDLNLPGADGWAALAAMERHRLLIPVVVITARPHQYERAFSARIDAIMEKPLDLPRLLQAIDLLLQESKSQRLARLAQSDFTTVDLTKSSLREALGKSRRPLSPLDD